MDILHFFVYFFQIYLNGYVVLGDTFSSANPQDPPLSRDVTMLAPLWVGSDPGPAGSTDTKVYYHTYTRWNINDPSADSAANAMMSRAKENVETFMGIADFEPTSVTVVTWENLRPFPYNVDDEEVRDSMRVTLNYPTTFYHS